MSFFNLPMFAFLRNGQQVVVTKDTNTPANTIALPVEITGANGDVAINAANLNIEVQTTAFGANPDSIQVIPVPTPMNSVLDAADVVETLTYADAGTIDERITIFTYTAPSVPATTVTKTVAYAGSPGNYRPTTATWAVV